MSLTEDIAKAMHKQCSNLSHGWINHLPAARSIAAEIGPQIGMHIQRQAVQLANEKYGKERTKAGKEIRILRDQVADLQARLEERENFANQLLNERIAEAELAQTTRQIFAEALSG